MNSIRTRVSITTIVAGIFATLSLPTIAAAIDIAAEIEKARNSTRKYEDINVALAEGFVPAPPGKCITAAGEGLPAELGGMGIHYINPALLKITTTEPRVDGESTLTDFTRPSILLYEPRVDGILELVAVENLVFIKAWEAVGNTAPPTFAGRQWDRMADDPGSSADEAHNFEPHYDQHVYLREHITPGDNLNPFSPTVTCEYYKES